MLAHSMAHVALRQGVQQSPGDVRYLAAIPILTLYGGATFGDNPKSTPLPAGYLNMHREHELAADRVAVAAMAAAGYDPHALVDYLARVQSRSSDAESPLPSLPVRLSNLGNAIRNLPAASPHPSAQLFFALQERVRGELKQAHAVPSLLHP